MQGQGIEGQNKRAKDLEGSPSGANKLSWDLQSGCERGSRVGIGQQGSAGGPASAGKGMCARAATLKRARAARAPSRSPRWASRGR